MKAYVFPGQGSQCLKMGEGLFDRFPELVQKADSILGYSVKTLCMEDPNRQLNQTAYTQTALFVVNSLAFHDYVDKHGQPDFVAGHSLGEYNALYAAGAFDFETGLQLVKKRGELMATAKDGGMAAIKGLDAASIKRVLEDNNIDTAQIANYNSPVQTVLSGLKSTIEACQPLFEKAGAELYFILNVSGAFHSKYMQPSQTAFAQFLENIPFNDLHIPVIANATADFYTKEQAKTLLAQQLTSAVRWTETMQQLLAMGDIEIVEIGPGTVLTKLVNRIKEWPLPAAIQIAAEKYLSVKQQATIIENKVQLPPMAVNGNGSIRNNEGSLLGSDAFKKDYGVAYAYVAGSMCHGISTKELIINMARAGFLSFIGTTGVSITQLEYIIQDIQAAINGQTCFGLNIIGSRQAAEEEQLITLMLKHQVRNLELSAYLEISEALVRFRASGLQQDRNGHIRVSNRIMTKVTHLEIAEMFMSPAPDYILKSLVQKQVITEDVAGWLERVPMADDICLQTDAGWECGTGNPQLLLPAAVTRCRELQQQYNYNKPVRIGLGGGIGTPYAAAAAFLSGADFILTGSVNQCTKEAGTSETVKALLAQLDVHDTGYVSFIDRFNLEGKEQVVKKGIFFPARANKLFQLYQQFSSPELLDAATRKQLEEKYFKKPLEQVFRDIENEVNVAAASHGQQMQSLVKWYAEQGFTRAMEGNSAHRTDYKIFCSPAMGAFNRWVKGTPLEKWENREVAVIARLIMQDTARYLSEKLQTLAHTRTSEKLQTTI
jgi:trans-AT polyketide synthase/acyltransferase/oxidoreductase domain-containing protein